MGQPRGARTTRDLILGASTGTKDPRASDVLYIEALAAPLTVNTMPEATLKSFVDHGEVGRVLPADGGDREDVPARFAEAGVDIVGLAARLQEEGTMSFVRSWEDSMGVIASKCRALAKAG